MRKSAIHHICFSAFLLCAGCTYNSFEEVPYGEPLDFLNLFTASIEEAGDDAFSILWANDDTVGVFAGGCMNKRFVIKENMNTCAVFLPEDGVAVDGPLDRINAYFPYSESVSMTDRSITIPLPSIQSYSPEGPSADILPMVCTGTTRSVVFKQVFGAIKLRLSNTEFGSVKRITLKSLDGKAMSGEASVSLDYDIYGEPATVISSQTGIDSVAVVCGDSGVDIQTKGSDFYFIVPPDTYEQLVFTIENSAGEIFESRPNDAVTVQRGKIADAGIARIYIEEFFYGKANCIRHDSAGTYTFDAAPYYSTDSYGYAYEFNTRPDLVRASSASLLRQSAPGMISNVSLSGDGTAVTFTAEKKGNALIGIYDGNGIVLWSFHIWISPVNTVSYPNGYRVMDRNLGALSNTPGDHAAWGLYYQWGRKDPLPEMEKNTSSKQMVQSAYYDAEDNPFILESAPSQKGVDQYWATRNPTTFIARAGSNLDWVWDCGNNRLWGNPEGYGHPDIGTLNKSVYDPCPEGYMVAPIDLWSANGVSKGSMENNQFDKSKEGRTLTFSGLNEWYPACSYYHNNYPSTKANLNVIGRYWTSAPDPSSDSKVFGIVWGDNEKTTYPEWSVNRAYGYNVRCVHVAE